MQRGLYVPISPEVWCALIALAAAAGCPVRDYAARVLTDAAQTRQPTWPPPMEVK
jgi:hypothetical protein